MLSAAHLDRVAILEGPDAFTFRALDQAANRVASALLDGDEDLREARIAILATPGFECIAALLGVWRAGGVAVPLAVSHPPAELDYVIRDAEAGVVTSSAAMAPTIAATAAAAGARLAAFDELVAAPAGTRPDVAASRRALILYTSGTTGKPKGVVSTHASLGAQIASLIDAWGWRPDVRTLLVLPLHHVHGLVNVVCCALAAGARCDVLPRFDAEAVWAKLAAGEVSVFTAVPTIYHRLIAAWDAAPDLRAARSAGVRRARLMMSGSAALPPSMLARWRAITGHTLLERYGMTEIGMALSNPLDGDRRPGSVGSPLPGVEVRLTDEAGAVVSGAGPGEIEVRGPGVFQEYWRRPEATQAAFRDGWFRSGDIAIVEDGRFRLLGRASIDIIKTGGFKVSALEIEDVIRDHPAVDQCAVVGVDDAEWGERVCAAVELSAGARLTLADLRQWAGSRLAPYKIPSDLRCVPALPRNAMGKVIKPDVARWFAPPAGAGGS